MIAIIGTNQKVLEGIADLTPSSLTTRCIQIHAIVGLSEKELLQILNIPSLVVMSLSGCYEESMRVVQQLRNCLPKIQILALDIHNSPSVIRHLIANGFDAYAPIYASAEELTQSFEGCLLQHKPIR